MCQFCVPKNDQKITKRHLRVDDLNANFVAKFLLKFIYKTSKNIIGSFLRIKVKTPKMDDFKGIAFAHQIGHHIFECALFFFNNFCFINFFPIFPIKTLPFICPHLIPQIFLHLQKLPIIIFIIASSLSHRLISIECFSYQNLAAPKICFIYQLLPPFLFLILFSKKIRLKFRSIFSSVNHNGEWTI